MQEYNQVDTIREVYASTEINPIEFELEEILEIDDYEDITLEPIMEVSLKQKNIEVEATEKYILPRTEYKPKQKPERTTGQIIGKVLLIVAAVILIIVLIAGLLIATRLPG